MDILDALKRTVEKVTNDEHDISPETHLVDDDVLDSLDSAVFLLELEKLYDIKLEDEIVDSRDLYKVSNMIDYIESSTSQ